MASRRPKILQVYRRAFIRGMDQAMNGLRDDIKKSLNVSNAGSDQPSQPGEPPRFVSTALRNGITALESVVKGLFVVGTVASSQIYGPRLEFGFVGRDSLGRNYSQAARPFMRPGLQRNKKRIFAVVARVVRAAMRARR